MTLWRIVLLLVGVVPALAAQSAARANVLPVPSGSFPIGRVTYDWIDSSRTAFLDANDSARREVMVDVWYPAARGEGSAASYLPDPSMLRRAFGDSVLRRQFAPAYALIEAGRLSTHATEGRRAACPRSGCPVLIFSHGGGVDRSSYTAQYEDLASHGYVVAAIAHTYDTHLVVFSDGHVARALPAPRDTTTPDLSLPRWRRDAQQSARREVNSRRVIAVEAADIRFVVDRLTRSARTGAGSPLVGQLDLNRIGALGHSAGGEAAAHACQQDARLKACLNQDGAIHGLPFSREAGGGTMDQPFMYFTRVIPRPVDPDSYLATMEMTRAEDDSLIEDVWTGPVRLLSDMPGGAYRVSLAEPGVPHMSFSDELLLQADGDSARIADARRWLKAINSYTRAFFDKTLRGIAAPSLDSTLGGGSAILVERFKPKPKPMPSPSPFPRPNPGPTP